MNLYIFENVLTDYTSGMAVIIADTLEEAQGFAMAEWGYRPAELLADYLASYEGQGFIIPTGVYPLTNTVYTVKGIKHSVHGGG